MLKRIISEKLFLRNYLLFMLVVAFCYFLLLHLRYGLAYSFALTDAFISVSLLATILMSLWFVVRYARQSSLTAFSSIRNSIIAGFMLVLVWHLVSIWILSTLFAEDKNLLEFIRQSQTLRFIGGFVMAGMVYLVFFLMLYRDSIKESLKRENELKELLHKTRLQGLKNQLNPHFIYNSLNSVSALTLYSPEKAREMIDLLSAFLRIALKQDALQMISLEQEIQNTELYLQIEKIRFEEKLQWDLQAEPACLSAKLPALILQPLVENAVKHGVQQTWETKAILLTAKLRNHYMEIALENYYDVDFQRFKGEGVGLENVRDRLKLIYGRADLINVSQEDGKFKVRILFPVSLEKDVPKI